MERDAFLFYRSFYEAIKDLPKDILLEVFTAIMEYGLYGRLPEDLKPFARGIFTLMKPIIDSNNARYENGKKGAKFGKRGGRPKKSAESLVIPYSLTYEQEVEQLRADDDCKSAVCADFNITAEEYDSRLSRFLRHCNDEKKRKGKERHSNYMDCQSHLRYWMSKAFTQTPTAAPENAALPFPDMGSDFGAIDYDEQ